jgi:hypothetical protein
VSFVFYEKPVFSNTISSIRFQCLVDIKFLKKYLYFFKTIIILGLCYLNRKVRVNPDLGNHDNKIIKQFL